MLKKDIVVGKTYWAKVSNNVVPVTIIREMTFQGRTRWLARNTKTNREIYIRSAARLRGEYDAMV